MELPGVGEPETLRARTRELPAPARGEALVRVEASGGVGQGARCFPSHA